MLEHTVKPLVFIADDRADCEAIVAMAAAIAGSQAALRLNPTDPVLLAGYNAAHSRADLDR